MKLFDHSYSIFRRLNLALFAIFLSTAGCDSPSALRCGEGTHADGGFCVPDPQDSDIPDGDEDQNHDGDFDSDADTDIDRDDGDVEEHDVTEIYFRPLNTIPTDLHTEHILAPRGTLVQLQLYGQTPTGEEITLRSGEFTISPEGESFSSMDSDGVLVIFFHGTGTIRARGQIEGPLGTLSVEQIIDVFPTSDARLTTAPTVEAWTDQDIGLRDFNYRGDLPDPATIPVGEVARARARIAWEWEGWDIHQNLISEALQFAIESGNGTVDENGRIRSETTGAVTVGVSVADGEGITLLGGASCSVQFIVEIPQTGLAAVAAIGDVSSEVFSSSEASVDWREVDFYHFPRLLVAESSEIEFSFFSVHSDDSSFYRQLLSGEDVDVTLNDPQACFNFEDSILLSQCVGNGLLTASSGGFEGIVGLKTSYPEASEATLTVAPTHFDFTIERDPQCQTLTVTLEDPDGTTRTLDDFDWVVGGVAVQEYSEDDYIYDIAYGHPPRQLCSPTTTYEGTSSPASGQFALNYLNVESNRLGYTVTW